MRPDLSPSINTAIDHLASSTLTNAALGLGAANAATSIIPSVSGVCGKVTTMASASSVQLFRG
jgi:hypothetical protein